MLVGAVSSPGEDEVVEEVEDIVEEVVEEVRVAGHVLSKGRRSQLRLVEYAAEAKRIRQAY